MQQYTRARAERNARIEAASIEEIEVSASLVFNYDAEALHYEDLEE